MAGNGAPIITTVIVGLIIVAGLGYAYYTMSGNLATLSSQNAGLSGQLANLNEQNFNFGQQVSSLNQQISNQNQQISGLNQQVSALQQKTVQVVTVQNTIETIETTTSTTTSTVTSITAVPQSTLVVVADHYGATNKTFYFQVQNTQNFIVYAQISATLTGDCGCSYSFMGFYISQIYQLTPLTMSTLSYNLTLTSYNGGNLNQKPVEFTLTLQTANSVAVSPTYTFQYPSANLVT